MKIFKFLCWLNVINFIGLAVGVTFFNYEFDKLDSVFASIGSAILFATWALEAK